MLSRKLLLNFTQIVRNASSDSKNAVATALYQLHVDRGGKMVNFAGYLLPVQYADLSIVNSHIHTRKSASLFDVSHMLQTEIRGDDCIRFFEQLCTADIGSMKTGTSVLTVFTNEKGGILDDLIITKISDTHLYIVSNAGCKEHDQQLILNALEEYRKTGNKVDIRFFDPSERSLVALQGPKAAASLQRLTDVNLAELYFMNSTEAEVAGVTDCRVTRCGYTGEDGFEISLPSDKAVEVTEKFLRAGVKLAGLGARDSLRLEAGLCLYGNDITESTTPIEAALTWLVSKSRRERRDFPGADVILNQIKNGVQRKRVGFVQESGPPARHDALIFSGDSKEIGVITSGCPGPSLGKNVAMGYVPPEFSKVGTKLKLKIREKTYDTVVAKMPFVPSNYYNKPK